MFNKFGFLYNTNNTLRIAQLQLWPTEFFERSTITRIPSIKILSESKRIGSLPGMRAENNYTQNHLGRHNNSNREQRTAVACLHSFKEAFFLIWHHHLVGRQSKASQLNILPLFPVAGGMVLPIRHHRRHHRMNVCLAYPEAFQHPTEHWMRMGKTVCYFCKALAWVGLAPHFN